MFSKLPELNSPIDWTGINIFDSQLAPSEGTVTEKKMIQENILQIFYSMGLSQNSSTDWI